MPRASDDVAVQLVKREILSIAQPDVPGFFLHIIRQGLDEVIDGGRTGRWGVDQLAKTEKTYIGTKVEILTQNALDVGRGDRLDLKICGEEVDVKMTTGTNWMIPLEARNEICLLLQGNEGSRLFAAGLLRMTDDNLTSGANQDKKVSVSALGKGNIDWIVPESFLPLNFLATLTQAQRLRIFAKRRGQARVTELLRVAIGKIIPRLVLETVAQQADPMKRIRSNGGARDELVCEGIVVLVGDWVKHRDIAVEYGLPILKPGEVISFKTTLADAIRLNAKFL